jgi:hypothetical protein
MASASGAAIDIPVLLREEEARGCLTAHVTATRLQRRRLLLWSAHPKRIPTPVSQALLTSFISTQDHDHRRHAALERPPFARTVADLATVQQRARRLAVFTARSPPPWRAAQSRSGPYTAFVAGALPILQDCRSRGATNRNHPQFV